jgi:hypothetical protein
MVEMRNVRQDPGDCFRRWFFDTNFDLIVWYQPDGSVFGFQLCYDKASSEKALTWTSADGFSHASVDTGEASPWFNRTPVLTKNDDRSHMARLLSSFQLSEEGLPDELQMLVMHKIKEYGGSVWFPVRR